MGIYQYSQLSLSFQTMWPFSIVASGKIEVKGGVTVLMSCHSLLYMRAQEEHCGAQAVITTSMESSPRYTSSVVLSVSATRSYGPS